MAVTLSTVQESDAEVLLLLQLAAVMDGAFAQQTLAIVWRVLHQGEAGTLAAVACVIQRAIKLHFLKHALGDTLHIPH